MKNFLKSLRPYQLLYIVSIYLLVATMYARVGRMLMLDYTVVYEIYNFSLIAPDGTVYYQTVWFGGVLVMATVLMLVGFLLSFSDKFKYQKRVVACSVILLAGYYVVYGYCLYSIFKDNNDVNTLNLDDIRFFSPFLVLILDIVIFFIVRRKLNRYI